MPDTSHITTSGGLISEQFIEGLRQVECADGTCVPETFEVHGFKPKGRKGLDDDMATAWELLLEVWDGVYRDLHGMDVPSVRRRWLMPLFQVLGFDPEYQRAAIQAADRLSFKLSHRGWPETKGPHAPILHMVTPPSKDYADRVPWLDKRAPDAKFGEKSPHDTLQQYLNVHVDRWGVVADGVELRLVRDYYHTYTKGYVAFDLESIFESRNYGDFRALYRMAHASRFLPDAEDKCPLERMYESSLAAGEIVGADLRKNVRIAIETLGNGMLTGDMVTRLQQDARESQEFYREVLTVVYRVLFLLFAEQRGMMPGRNSLYAEEYSISRLRERAEGNVPQRDPHTDLWEGLKVTFQMVEHGVPDLEVFGYNGELFADRMTPLINGLACGNAELLQAVRSLTLFERGGVLQRINYAELGVEEIGSVYESLLDYEPRVSTQRESFEVSVGATSRRETVDVPSGRFFLDPRGAARKTSGSYYTSPKLVHELIKSALVPVIEDRLAQAGEDPSTRETALLNMKVCDPACGSAAFLIAATNTLGQRLAQVRTGDDYPSEKILREARRDVLAHCIYGVDLNPMAVELAKVSLWINAAVTDQPLNFLDHHIRYGNSLIGATPELIEIGVPDDAFKPVTGDDREVARQIKAKNKRERESGQMELGLARKEAKVDFPARLAQVEAMPETTGAQIEAKRNAYLALREDAQWKRALTNANLWTAAFFWPQNEKDEKFAPTFDMVRAFAEGRELQGLATAIQAADAMAALNHWFHWHLEFPEVFSGENPGFDVVLGNPPWERIKIQEKEWFEWKDPAIAGARNAAERKRMIKNLLEGNPDLAAEFEAAKHDAEAEGRFLRASGRYPLGAQGDINTYVVFTEHGRSILTPTGGMGIIVPAGIATDNTTKELFGSFVESKTLVSLWTIQNEMRIFQEVHHSFRFALLSLSGPKRPVDGVDFVIATWKYDELFEEDRHFTLSREDFRLLNPNTRTCPTFLTKRDAEITKKIYRTCPVLWDENSDEGNPWSVKFSTMFHMTNDSGLFRTRSQLEGDGYRLEDDGNFIRSESTFLRLYEAKHFFIFNHRHGTFEGVSGEEVEAGYCRELNEEVVDKDLIVIPRYWVDEKQVDASYEGNDEWFLSFRGITFKGNIRTLVPGIIPKSAVGNSAPLIEIEAPKWMSSLLYVNLSTFVADFAARQKLSGNNVNFFILKQLPALPPDRYTPEVIAFIKPRVLELVYTAHDMEPFARDMGYEGPPFTWDEERRAQLRAELDALYFHLYGLTRDEADYVMETFPIVKRKDEAAYGSYRTKEMILAEFDKLAGSTLIAGETTETVKEYDEIDVGEEITPLTVRHQIVLEQVREERRAAPDLLDEYVLLMHPTLCEAFLGGRDRSTYLNHVASLTAKNRDVFPQQDDPLGLAGLLSRLEDERAVSISVQDNRRFIEPGASFDAVVAGVPVEISAMLPYVRKAVVALKRELAASTPGAQYVDAVDRFRTLRLGEEVALVS